MFTHLHVHSYFSFCRGVDSIERICNATRERGMDAVAITDTNGLYGLIWFLLFARSAGVRPIVGAELPLDRVRQAHDLIDRAAVVGKIVLTH